MTDRYMTVPGLADELRALANKKRTRKNFESIADQICELAEHAEAAVSVTEALGIARESLQELINELEIAGDDNPLITQSTTGLREAAENLLANYIPEEGEDIGSLVEEAVDARNSYEEIMDDRDYDADARDEAWGELCNALDNIAETISPKKAEVQQ